jgi:protein tyrosine/serine phosphatase
MVRFSTLGGGLYRGGQPNADGFQFLKDKGIKTIINLRSENVGEADLVNALGMKYIPIPITEVWPWSQVPETAIAEFFELVNNRANYPVFFHCRRGAERTGTLAAMYRIAAQGWNPQTAYAEARKIGMRWFYAGLKRQIYAFEPRKK